MSNITKFSIACTLSISLSILISQCKSPVPQPEALTAKQADTTTVADTAKNADVPIASLAASHTPLTLIIKNLASSNAPVVVGLYGTTNKFPDPKDQLKEYHFAPNGPELIAKIEDMQFGLYALAIYQDVNSNGKIDRNIIGVPTEPYAFSNNYHPRVRAPGFSDCKFNYDSISNTVTMNMIK